MTLPWEISAGTLPFELPSVLFPRTIKITRIANSTASGLLPPQGVTEAAEATIATGIICNIAIAASGRNVAQGDLPADSPGPIKYTIILPPSVMGTLPILQEGDIIYDDLISPDSPNGRRFQISGFEPTSLGAKIDSVRLLT